MDSTALLTLYRQQMDDLAEPYLWADDEIFEYMTQAQQMFCRESEGIADAQTASDANGLPLCVLPIVAATEWYPMSPLLLKTRLVTRTDTGMPVPIVNVEKLGLYGITFTSKTSVLQALVAGLSANTLRTYPIPSETVNLAIACFRLPLYDITDYDQPLEIDAQHHRNLALYMRSLGYAKQDADTFDAKRADEYESKFMAYCAKSRAEQERARRVVGATVYGGIGGSTTNTGAWASNDYYNIWK